MSKVGIQTDYVVESTIEVEIAEEQHASDELNLQLVDMNKFIALFGQYYPASIDDPTVLWHTLFGNDPVGEADKRNKNVCYLTTDSCEKLLGHYQLFKESGIDFQHLPRGFFLAKNPLLGGVRDVLHFSDYLATHDNKTNPLAVILSPKPVGEIFEADHGFLPPQSTWYEFLRGRICANGVTYCSEKELKDAFITFSNTLKRLNLPFYNPDFSMLQHDFNPIILLGRWDTVLTQPNLKKINLKSQWQQLLNISLTKGYNALRAITDYENTQSPCGFILPEMFFNAKFSFIQKVQNSKEIMSRQRFWCYLAYQPQCNSIEFYKKALRTIDLMKIHQSNTIDLRQILAGSTTGKACLAKNAEEESRELKIWDNFCDLIDTLPNATLALKAAATFAGGDENIKNNFIHHLTRLDELPNIPFLHSMAECIKEHLDSLSLAQVALAKATGSDPLQKLVDLSDKLNFLITNYHMDFYEGARFYLVNSKWIELSVQKYVELQYDLNKIDRNASALLLPYLSTFHITSLAQGTEIIHLLMTIPLSHRDAVIYCLNFFKDVNQQHDKDTLIKIVQDICNSELTGSLIPLLEYVQSNFTPSFPAGYFEKKKEQLIDSQYGLNNEQKINVHNLHLSAEQTMAIISIESAMVRKNNLITTPELEQLNETFLQLSRLFTGADFTEFTLRLVSIRESMPQNPATLSKLLTLLAQQRTLESFNQIFFRNKIEKANDDALINKFNLYIETIKPLGKTQGTISSLNIQDLLATIVLNCSLESFHEDFVEELNSILETLKNVSDAHPHIQQHLLDAFVHIPNKLTPEYFTNIIKFIGCIDSLLQILQSGDDEVAQNDMLMFFALLANFNPDPMGLVSLWEKLVTLANAEQQKFFISLVNSLIQNKQSLDGLDELILKVTNDDILFQKLAAQCTHPPYPAIKTIDQWLSGDEFETKYQIFSKRPYGKRRFDFAFIRQEFDNQKVKFSESVQPLFTDDLATTFEEEIRKNRSISVQDLQKSFLALKEKDRLSNEQKQTLLCVCIEMLARTTSQFDHGVPPRLISQELNTTQIMALYAMLTNPNHKLISEIDTGEGKSRIMMILAACQVAQGKTVDFMTSDMQLAERDYLTYNAFFCALGIRTSLISLNTPKQLYQKGGVNFSDNSQLLLLRNKSDINLDPFAYLDENEEHRCLLVDEADKFQHDKSQDSFNYATKSKKLNGFIWIYPFLVDFVRQTLEENPKAEFDIQKMNLTDKFVDFIAIHDKDDMHKASIASLKNNQENQLITWLNAAYKALQMKEDNDYKVTENTEAKLFAVRDVDGYIRYTRKVLVLDNGRPVEGSTFSDGVHQCLCAIENEKAGKEAFVIPSENVTQRASYPVSFMANYEKGHIFGVSGTTRSEGPTANKAINYENYDYLRVPRQKELRREDKKVWAAKDKAQQLAFIKESILEKLRRTPPWPVLLICKNDEQSKEIYEALIADKQLMSVVANHTRVHGLTEKDDEIAAIAEAGKPGYLTVSTAGMFSRGVDINAAELLVLAAYVPTPEDEIQIKGRTGRFGKPGEYRMIPNVSDTDCHLNGRTYNIHNEINKAQKGRALKAVCHEEISKLYADFLEDTHQVFLTSLAKKPKLEQLQFLETWQKYLDNLQKDWDAQKDSLLKAIETNKKEEFATLFETFTEKWKTNIGVFIKDEKSNFNADKANITYDALKNQQQFFKAKRQPIKVQRSYDRADDGQACIYSSLFAQTRATLRGDRAFFADIQARKEGRGALFPDLMATLRGERPLFANLRATISRLIAELKVWWANKPVVTPVFDVDEEVTFSEDTEDDVRFGMGA